MQQNEQNRLRILREYQILDTPFELCFDRITELARTIFETPIALVSLVDEDRQWFKSCLGLNVRETPRDQAFCDYTIKGDEILVIENARIDSRTASNPLVTGDPHIVFYAGAPLITPEGVRLGSLCIIDRKVRDFAEKDKQILRQLSDLVMDEFNLRRKAEIDWLTGAASRGSFHSLLSLLALRADRPASCQTAVIALDIDHFKQINDCHGHAKGDEVLIAVVAACRSVLRECDVVARTGGEEFTVLLPETNRRAAEMVAERLRQTISELSFETSELAFSITASFGVTMMDKEDGAISRTIERADQALYLAKERGRNQVVCCWEERETSMTPSAA